MIGWYRLRSCSAWGGAIRERKTLRISKHRGSDCTCKTTMAEHALFYLGFVMNDHLKIEFEDKMIWPARNPSVQCKISTGFTWLSFRWAQRSPFDNMGCLNMPGPCHIGAFSCEFITGFHGSRMLTLRQCSPLKEQHVALSWTWSYEISGDVYLIHRFC